MKSRIQRRIFLILHLALLGGILLFPLYQLLADALPEAVTGCLLLNRLHLYCGVCGGTRAVDALLHLRVVDAVHYNLFVTISLLGMLVLDIIAWVRFFRHKNPFFYIHWSIFIIWGLSFVGYLLLRNFLLVKYGIDPTGDLGPVWEAIHAQGGVSFP